MPDIEATEHLLQRLAEQLQPIVDQAPSTPHVVGIHTGGALVAEALHRLMRLDTELGSLDITFYRDDFSQIGLHPQVHPSHLPFDVDGKTILLVDDVLHTGRTIRAAMNELFDYGRPSAIHLAVLFDRPGRQLPIAASAVGQTIDLDEHQNIRLMDASTLRFDLVTKEPTA